jgi:hypothetical protein
MLDHVKQKKDKAWKKIPPKDDGKHKKEYGKQIYYCCKHHMAWTMHPPSNCHLGKEQNGRRNQALPLQLLLSLR